ncbi:histone-lysine N-methyltransferase, H3 lysine-9 specific SUVH4-like isoform X1 [Prosopis cineraria]|uniref:histone-lysine N-methyltransferase, H3 lysine-9 specific SUVH4-like isoform X1 n=1 Tax=Prosopis cineraria TaxID=364024 RepID=UPI00241039DA|nr:histone-lysine N-methyltransferase, H3 lysine-9 specific SUVH4-like isoform X1 [Prosopis cineraria]XP_054803544.1 histone-lysine N-methyltransferase, H3 lysine-9 specific SUVH4-like isoform X1 [Prosopis cineraria]XP_054803545.1 histone-lysine N-methyltransferase, H3 lysine-9 specific SUVH4-like isoform X1 [Prosopis cineraria]
MGAQSLNRTSPNQSPIANSELGAGMGRRHSVVSTPRRNIIPNGHKCDKTEEPNGSKNSSIQRRTSPRIQAKHKVDMEPPVCRRDELPHKTSDAKMSACKTSVKCENADKQQTVGGPKRTKNLDNSTTVEPLEFKKSLIQRRTSPRIRAKQKVDKALAVQLSGDRDNASDVKKNTACKRSRNDENVCEENVVEDQQKAKKLNESITEEPNDDNESSGQRMANSRVQNKEFLVRRRVELLEDRDKAGNDKKSKCFKRSCNDENGDEHGDKEGGVGKPPRVKKLKEATVVHNKQTSAGSKANGAGNLADKSDFVRVKETLRLFNKHYLHFVQEEENRCNKVASSLKVSKRGSKSKKNATIEVEKTMAKRPDLKALSKMMENKETLYPEKRIGDIPGIKVGHQFYSRAEMVAVGFHSHWLNGIDYMGQAYSKVSQYSHYEFPLAVAIVLSGMYEDDLDNAEDVVYTGQGGHNLTGDKRQIRDQVLERGNLALKNCMEQCVSVRVVRGHESSNSYSGKVYTYDGLYKVVNYWAEKGISGFTVFKFRLRRLDGQPTLTTKQVYFINGRAPQSIAEIRGLVCEDITKGEEDVPIPATNLIDDPPVAPKGFKYKKSISLSKNVKLPPAVTGCKCKGLCVDPTSCECALRNGSDFPYVSRNGGRLIEAKDVVFECGPNCGCGPGCVNRTSQRGPRYRLEVFRTAKKGWAVRSWDFIPSGAPVCEYTGLIRRTEDVENTLENNYIFEIDCLQTMKGIGGRERRSQNETSAAVKLLDNYANDASESAPEFCIDAGSIGNIARFINHSCEPNLFVQCVLSSHHDLRLARVMLFAADNIPPLQELTYDYGYALDSVLSPDGKVKKMTCYCGAADCRKRLF